MSRYTSSTDKTYLSNSVKQYIMRININIKHVYTLFCHLMSASKWLITLSLTECLCMPMYALSRAESSFTIARCPHSACHCDRKLRGRVEQQSPELIFLNHYICSKGAGFAQTGFIYLLKKRKNTPKQGHFHSRRPNGSCSSTLWGLSIHVPGLQSEKNK